MCWNSNGQRPMILGAWHNIPVTWCEILVISGDDLIDERLHRFRSPSVAARFCLGTPAALTSRFLTAGSREQWSSCTAWLRRGEHTGPFVVANWQ